MANASSRGRRLTRISRSAAISSFTRRSISLTSSACMVSNSKSMRPESGSMLPPVTCAPWSFHTTPHSTWSAEWVRMSLWRRSQSTSAVTVAPTSGSEPSGPAATAWTMSPPAFRAPVTVQVGPPSVLSQPASEGWPPPPG